MLAIYYSVPSDLSLLASGIRAFSAGEMPKVPKGQGLGRLARWLLLQVFFDNGQAFVLHPFPKVRRDCLQ